MLCCPGRFTSSESIFEGSSCFQGIPQERGDKMSNPHVCCAAGGTGIPLAAPLSQHCDKARQSPGQGAHGCRAASIQTSISTQLQAGTGTNATKNARKMHKNKCQPLGAAYTTRSSALLSSAAVGLRGRVQGHKTDQKIAKFQNPTPGSKEYQRRCGKRQECPLQQLPAAKFCSQKVGCTELCRDKRNQAP